MANLSGFDAGKVGEMQNFEAIPAQKAIGMITASEMKPTKDGKGAYLQCEFTIMDGPFHGRKVWARLNLSNHNKQAEDIAQRELGSICRAVGVMKPNDSIELHNMPMILDIGYEPATLAQPATKDKPAKDARKAQNTIKGYAPVAATGFTVPIPGGGASAAPAAAPVAPPWAR